MITHHKPYVDGKNGAGCKSGFSIRLLPCVVDFVINKKVPRVRGRQSLSVAQLG